METPPLAEEVVVGTSREEEEDEGSSSPNSQTRLSGAAFHGQGKRGAYAEQQPPRKIRMTSFEEGEEEASKHYADGMEVMDLRVGAMSSDHGKIGLTAKN